MFGDTLKWDSSGKSLMFTYMYTSKIDGKNHTATYIAAFDKQELYK